MLEALLKAGARPDVGATVGPISALGSKTPLHMAAQYGKTAAVAALLEGGARLEAGVSLLFGLLPVATPLFVADNEATKTALSAAIARAAGDKEL